MCEAGRSHRLIKRCVSYAAHIDRSQYSSNCPYIPIHRDIAQPRSQGQCLTHAKHVRRRIRSQYNIAPRPTIASQNHRICSLQRDLLGEINPSRSHRHIPTQYIDPRTRLAEGTARPQISPVRRGKCPCISHRHGRPNIIAHPIDCQCTTCKRKQPTQIKQPTKQCRPCTGSLCEADRSHRTAERRPARLSDR